MGPEANNPESRWRAVEAEFDRVFVVRIGATVVDATSGVDGQTHVDGIGALPSLIHAMVGAR